MRSYAPTDIPVSWTNGGHLFIGPIPPDENAIREIVESGYDTVVTLATDTELAELGCPGMQDAFLRHGVNWTHFPIADFDIPGEAETKAWRSIETLLVQRLKHGGRIMIHCRAGFGRSGMIAARLLIACGSDPDLAVATVRAARPGAIETPAQLDWAKSAGAI
ncbi:hypothetical protein NUH88_01845 [Nisaea acidiphila]|uniref:Tyrosine specific protein phosphatases domain-containing protein n=1 Tax=Nisaea acidiphila TaxID=1862145 RepID=A0A9J7AUE2_9PROT|nr:protein-tyrosine phosphatase family protein [Nisaea acidiphila]UUX50442.1 hypothetical protein NUH88_01845 [Nisaea acidiphila]